MRQYSSVVNFIIKNHPILGSYIYQNPKKDLFTYKYDIRRDEVSCGLKKLWLCLNIFSPQMVVDYQVHKTNIEELTLISCNNNLNTFLATVGKMRIVINLMLPDKQEFDDHRFVTIMFDHLLKSSF